MTSPAEWLPLSARRLDPFALFADARDVARRVKGLAGRLGKGVPPGATGLVEAAREGGDAARANAALLASGQAVAVITGQQPLLLGGPGYVLYKALTAVAVARWIKKRCRIAAVPVFWSASEDHDLAEILRAYRCSPAGTIQRLGLPARSLRMAAESLPWSADLDKLIGHHLPAWLRERAGLGGEGRERYADHFTRLLARLFAEDGLVVVEPRHFVEPAGDFFHQLTARPGAIVAAFDHDEHKLLEQGVSLQAPRRSRIPIFALDPVSGRRVPLHWSPDEGKGESGRWHLPDEALGAANPRDLLRPGERLSPGALLRPALAQFLFPAAVSVLGPGEWLYHQQTPGVFAALGLEMPLIWPRLSGTHLPAGLRARLEAAQLRPEDMLSSSWKPGAGWGQELESALSRVEAALAHLRKAAHRRFLAHKGALLQFERRLQSDMDRLRRKLIKEELARRGVPAGFLDALRGYLAPLGRPQERVHGFAFLLESPERFAALREIFSDPLDFTHRLYEFGD